ncbi:Glutathione S-transferase omega-1 [Sparganum proliferum]
MQHLKEGDPEPSVDPEKFTLYDMHFCPYCQRVRYTLDYHQIPYDRILIDLSSKPSWYLQMYPVGKVPLLLYRGEKMAESDIIMKYVDQFKGAEPSLLSVCGEEGFKKALELSSAIAVPRYKLCFSPEPTRDDADALKAALSNLEKAIKHPYLMGKEVSLADLAVFPFLHAWDFLMSRLLEIDENSGDNVETVASQWPSVQKYCQLMNQRPYIKKTAFRDDELVRLVESRVPKKSDARQ